MARWTKHKKLSRSNCSMLPPGALETLQNALRGHWTTIRRDSEKLARSIGLDELRVDWLLGDTEWGPRVGELTYMGTFCLAVAPVSVRLARAFSAAHLLRLSLLTVSHNGDEPTPAGLWPVERPT